MVEAARYAKMIKPLSVKMILHNLMLVLKIMESILMVFVLNVKFQIVITVIMVLIFVLYVIQTMA